MKYLIKTELLTIAWFHGLLSEDGLEKLFKDGHLTKKTLIFVGLSSTCSEEFLLRHKRIFDRVPIPAENYYLFYNSAFEMGFGKQILRGYRSILLPNNMWLDPEVLKPSGIEKIYDACLIAKLSTVKRHELARTIPELCVVTYPSEFNMTSIPEIIKKVHPKYINHHMIPVRKVNVKINQSHVGLCLSAAEGNCYAAVEYLLCGIPVVSTKSTGGRDIWFNQYNSIIVKDDPEEIYSAVKTFKESAPNPERVREKVISQIQEYRSKFTELLKEIFQQFGVDINAHEFLHQNFHHKMLRIRNMWV